MGMRQGYRLRYMRVTWDGGLTGDVGHRPQFDTGQEGLAVESGPVRYAQDASKQQGQYGGPLLRSRVTGIRGEGNMGFLRFAPE